MPAKIHINIQEKKWSVIDLKKVSKRAFKSTFKILAYSKIYKFLDSSPSCLTATEHRPAYGSDGDYFSKPSSDDIFEKIYSIMSEYDPLKYKKLF